MIQKQTSVKPCVCNIAHAHIYELDKTISDGSIDHVKVRNAIGILILGKDSPVINRQAKKLNRKQEGIGCEHFLVRGGLSLLKSGSYVCKERYYWGAILSVNIELLKLGHVNRQIIPVELRRYIPSEINLNDCGLKQLCRLCLCFYQFMTKGCDENGQQAKNLKYEDWLEIKKLLGINSINDIVLPLQKEIDNIIGRGFKNNTETNLVVLALRIICMLWATLEAIYAREVRNLKKHYSKVGFDIKNKIVSIGIAFEEEVANKEAEIKAMMKYIRQFKDDDEENSVFTAVQISRREIAEISRIIEEFKNIPPEETDQGTRPIL